MTVSSTTGTTPATAAAASNPLSALTGNFKDFLSMLMTQLQNQDPTSPMDTNQFTSQLVQFTSVEQQIDTNASLTTLIQATQGNNLLQSTALIGQKVDVSGTQVSLQSGHAGLNYNSTNGQPVTIDILSPSGAVLKETTVTPASGANSWTWDGKDANGVALPDGAYTATVKSADGTTVPFTTVGVVTGVQRTGTSMNISMGGLSVDLNSVQQVGVK